MTRSFKSRMPSPQVESVSELCIKPLSTYHPLLGQFLTIGKPS
jgi:hypothetical protein